MDGFIISDESVLNSDKFRVLTGQAEEEGINVKGYEKNLPVYHNHDWIIGKMPIGQTEKLEKKNSLLLATPKFDTNDIDPETQRVIQKVKDGVLKGASVGIDIIEWSEDPKLMLDGQHRPTVTKSVLFEWSITGTPSNRNAVKLSCKKKGVMLSADVDKAYLNILLPIIEKHPKKMEEVRKKLGLGADADEQQVIAAIEALNKRSTDMLLSMGRASGVVNAENEKHFATLAAKDFDSTFALLQMQKPKKTTTPAVVPNVPATEGEPKTITEALATLSKQLKETGQAPADDKSTWNFDKWSKEDPQGLLALKNSDPEKYATLAKGYKGRKQ